MVQEAVEWVTPRVKGIQGLSSIGGRELCTRQPPGNLRTQQRLRLPAPSPLGVRDLGNGSLAGATLGRN